MPRRMTTGIDFNRCTLLTAILEKKLGYSMGNQDIYINVTGGLKINEPACDLAVITAIASNYKNFVIDENTLILGEVGLSGEVRAVSHIRRRIDEATKMGFKKCIIPSANSEDAKGANGVEIIPVSTVKEALHNLIS